MQINIDLYTRNLRMFYQQLVKGHKRQQQLTGLFKSMIEGQMRKWKKTNLLRRDTMVGANGGALARLREKKNGKDKSKLLVDVLYASQKIQYQIVFGYCFLIMEHRNVGAYQLISDNLKLILQRKGALNDIMGRRMIMFLDKMEQVVSGRRKVVRIEKQMQDSFKELPQIIIDSIYQIIVQNRSFPVQHQQRYLQQISSLLTIRIDFFEIDSNDNVKVTAFGEENQARMRFGFFKQQSVYGYVSKMPEKQEAQINKEVTLQKFSEIADRLNFMYTSNMKEYLLLNNFKSEKLKRSSSISSNFSVSPLGVGKKVEHEFTNI